ncbi:MAG: hypothetical protein JNK72_17840 [Myxococcales bacterium]|nr:hypothetical protein [Myxococcales bacterium]
MIAPTFRFEIDHDEASAIRHFVAPHLTLEYALRDALSTPHSALFDVVVQDEFTHDVVLRWRSRYLVYDAT